ncbi:sensor histidine kinase [Terrisporobacter sp.]|uniref:sensor histidine kinase n=1 Tax=Terrisporobacter sp. TaxID=1965305 RepID=UPI003995FD8B
MKYRKYFSNINNILESLDKKYLLPEVLQEPNFMVGENINDILKELSRDMHEQVKHYRNIQEEYREYIEMWVHEIKTPIASSKLLIENNTNEVTRKIDTQMDRIENYVEQVLYYSRSDEVGKDYIIKKVGLSKLVKDVIKRNQRDFISKRISLQLGDLDEIIYSDTKWVEFILNQIIGNAIKYSKGKDDKIEIYLKKISSAVILTIKDHGVGIIERDLNRVFEKGFTGENGRKFGKSTGIGLYLCKKLTDKLGLGLQVQSEENVGTEISIIFPKSENISE